MITPSESYVLVRIDMSRVEKLMLEINMDQIRNAIISAPKLKLKSLVCYISCLLAKLLTPPSTLSSTKIVFGCTRRKRLAYTLPTNMR